MGEEITESLNQATTLVATELLPSQRGGVDIKFVATGGPTKTELQK